MNLRTLTCYLITLFIFSSSAFAGEPKLTFYLPFDGNATAKIAGGAAQGKYGIKDAAPQFAEGISGQGFLTGASHQEMTFPAAGNISPDHWTITFWVKGLPGAQWNGGKYLQGFWQLNGDQGEIMWFYRYATKKSPWLFSRPKKGKGDSHWLMAPAAPEEQWHFWAVSWRKGSGAYLYLDGRLVGQSPCQPPQPVKTISIGQPANPSEQNKIIDEFKIYDSAMDSGAIARQYWREGNMALSPSLTVAPAKQKITIDGNIQAAEWKDTAGFSGLLDTQTWSMEAPRTQVKSTFDNQYLYLALHSDNPPEVKNDPDNAALHGFVKKDAVQPDGNVKDDDHFFIELMPPDKKLYTIRINGIDTIQDASTNAAGQEDVSWQSAAIAKSIVNANGWSLEVAIPLQSLGVTKIADGAEWQVNMGRVWKLLRQRTDIWAAGKRTDNAASSELGSFTFAAAPDAVAHLDQFTIAPDGHVAAVLNVSNPGTQAYEITAILSANDKTLATQKITLNGGTAQAINLSALPKDAGGALLKIDVSSGAKVLLHQAAPIILDRVGQLALWSYPGSGQIRLGWVIQSDADPHALNLTAQITDSNGKTAREITVSSLPALSGSTLADIKTLPDGKYTIEIKVSDGNNVLQQQALTYDKQPLPDWLGNSLGISDTPPQPWTAIQVDQTKDALSVWGRTYDYAGNLLPEQIINQGKDMLAAPMQIIANTNGNAASTLTGKTSSAKWTDTRAVHSASLRQQKLGPLQLTANSYVEYDGMTWLELTADPQGAKVLLDGLTIEIPLKAEWAKLIKPYDDYRLQHTGLLPADGWKGNASSMPWIGNGDGGFQVFQETTASWIGSKSIEIVPAKNGTVMMRLHLVDAQTTIDKPLHFALGWMASPVKPAPRNHRDWRLLNAGPFASDAKGTGIVPSYIKQAVKLNPHITPYLPWWQGWWWLPETFDGNPDRSGLVPVPDEDKTNAIRHYYGIKFFGAPYGRLTEMGTANPWFAQFGDEWVPSTTKYTPDTTLAAAQRITKVSQAARSLRDFYAWGYNQLLKDGNVHALYFDVSRPSTDSNIYHGAGTQMPDGSIEPMRNILGTRRTFQRIYTLMKAQHPDGRIFYHMSGEVMLPVDSFCDSMIDGENYTGLLDRKENRGYEKVLSVDQFRTEYSAQNNFGPASVFLPEFGRSKAILPEEWETLGYQHARYLLGLVLLHDSSIWWTYFPAEVLSGAYSALDKTGWNADWKFVPYWNRKYFQTPNGVYASIYQSPDSNKDVLIVMNTSGKDQQLSIPLTLDKSTFSTAKVLFPEAAPLTQTLEVPDNDFRIVLLEK